MHTRASNSELVEPLPEPERTLNRRLCRQNRRVPFDQTNNPPQHPRIVYPPILNINYFRHFLDILRNYNPMDDEPMSAANCVVAPIPSSAITIPETANEFAIKGDHLTLVKGNQFDGRTKTDPHKHIYEFLKICDMFKYRDIKNEAVRLMMFPLSLTGEEKTWLDKLKEGTIETWDELRTAFISYFFPQLFLTDSSKKSYKELQSRAKQPTPNPDDDDMPMSREEEAKFMQTFRKTRFYNDYRDRDSNRDNWRSSRWDYYNRDNYQSNTDDKPIDVIDEILEEDFDALLDEGSKILYSIEGTFLEEEIFFELNKFIAMTIDENSESESDTEEPPFKKITINTNYKVKTSLKEPPTDLELKSLHDNLEYKFLEEPSFLPLIISS
uniref:Reverse transcriptase domain-containing protein n=1 Tax=Tanacetum cinerariifolium TaxID=118510 RepID=A0A699H365_TANCI|nr:reverse transcriptase domain-containing protein [Tanacetum cinerariifolium]